MLNSEENPIIHVCVHMLSVSNNIEIIMPSQRRCYAYGFRLTKKFNVSKTS